MPGRKFPKRFNPLISLQMNARIFLSITILGISLILLIFPDREGNKGQPSPLQEVHKLEQTSQSIDVDKTARLINESDTSYQLIDVRSPEEYRAFNLPGSINIPLDELLTPQWQGYLKPDNKINILYANGDFYSNLAVSMLKSKGYSGNITLEGGLNEWFAIIMNFKFEGGKITARENAIFENRTRAKNLFTQINSLPDSLKNNYLEAKLLEEKELLGGCE